jgi:hypothetical protein
MLKPKSEKEEALIAEEDFCAQIIVEAIYINWMN